MSIVRNRRSVSVIPGDFDTSGLPTRFFNPGELATLLTLFDQVKAKTIIEFGVNAGRNPAAALRNFPDLEKYVGIDVTPGYRTALPVQRKEVPANPGELVQDARFELVLRDRGSYDLDSSDLPKADAIFIDGDHSASGVLNDWALAKQLIKPGGIVIFHDDNCRPEVEVTQTLNAIEGHEFIHVDGTWLTYCLF